MPHYTESLVLFKTLDDEACSHALSFSLTIVALLHDILQYLCAHSRLGSSHARLGSQKMEFVSADWGGSEGIGKWNKKKEILPVGNNLQKKNENLGGLGGSEMHWCQNIIIPVIFISIF